MNKKSLPVIIIVVLLVIGGAAYFLISDRSGNEKIITEDNNQETYIPPTEQPPAVKSSSPAPATPIPTPLDSSSAPSKPVLEFSAGGCDSNMDPYTEPFEGIISKSWTSASVLSVNAYVKTLCEGINIVGSHELSGNNLTLRIDMTHSGSQGECYCARKLTYKISNLEQKEYQVSIIRGE